MHWGHTVHFLWHNYARDELLLTVLSNQVVFCYFFAMQLIDCHVKICKTTKFRDSPFWSSPFLLFPGMNAADFYAFWSRKSFPFQPVPIATTPLINMVPVKSTVENDETILFSQQVTDIHVHCTFIVNITISIWWKHIT
jgi:hypothetical protein